MFDLIQLIRINQHDNFFFISSYQISFSLHHSILRLTECHLSMSSCVGSRICGRPIVIGLPTTPHKEANMIWTRCQYSVFTSIQIIQRIWCYERIIMLPSHLLALLGTAFPKTRWETQSFLDNAANGPCFLTPIKLKYRQTNILKLHMRIPVMPGVMRQTKITSQCWDR